MLKLISLTVERVKEPTAAPCSGLRFSWVLDGDGRYVFQSSFRLVVSHRDQIVFDSGTVESSQSVDVVPELTLLPGADYGWSVSVSADSVDGELAAFAESRFATGLRPEDFSAAWIKPKKHREGACVYFRRDFRCEKPIVRAVAYIAGLGYGTLYLNGSRVDDIYFDAPFTNYEKTVLYRAYDLTSLLKSENAIGVHCGEGFYSQSRVWVGKGFKYGDICCLAQINIEYSDGTSYIFGTDTDWDCAYSPAVLSNVHGGEIYDARLENPDWCVYGSSDDTFTKAVPDTVPKGELEGALLPPCRVIRRVKPVSVTQLNGRDSGLWVYDMGENFAGVVQLHLPPSVEGSEYVLRFAELLDESGHLDYRSTGVYHTYVQQQDIYIASGKPNEVWAPEFTYHTFRYVELTGFYGREPSLDLMTGLAISTDFDTIGKFECSDDDINRLQTLMLRTIRSNYHGFPEDCPGREKCGWLGDAQIVSDTAIYNYDMVSSYEKYMSDIRTSRQVYGTWTMIAPGKRTCGYASPLWGCAQIIIPYNLYMYSGDTAVLREYYPDMCDWVQHELERSEDFIISDGLGDWCPPTGNDAPGRIPVPHSSTLMFYEETKKLAEISRALEADGSEYDRLAEKIKTSFNAHFYDTEKHTYGYAASNAAAWLLGVCPEADRDALVASTVEIIEVGNYKMDTGIYGNKYLLPMLYEAGRGEAAHKLCFDRGHIDFGTMLDDDAGSLWECLNLKSVGQKGDIPSYNHPMHSGFAYLYYAHLAGIRPLKPGFSEFELRPCLPGAPERVYAEYMTPYGLIISDRVGKRLTLTVPANTECSVNAASGAFRVGSGKYTFDL